MTRYQCVDVPARKVMRQITMDVTITGVKAQSIRTNIGVWLIRLAARVIGVGIDVHTQNKPNML